MTIGSDKRDRLNSETNRPWLKPLIGFAIVAVWLTTIVLLDLTSMAGNETNAVEMGERLSTAGMWGVPLVIGLMAITAFGPVYILELVALAAEATFGSVGGTVCLVIGAFLSAMISFAVWRLVGLGITTRLFARHETLARLWYPNVLMGIMVIGYILPGLSAREISLFAGALTLLSPTRYAISAALGLTLASTQYDQWWRPAEFISGDYLWSYLIFVAMAVIAAIFKWASDRRAAIRR